MSSYKVRFIGSLNQFLAQYVIIINPGDISGILGVFAQVFFSGQFSVLPGTIYNNLRYNEPFSEF